mgnify:FL=1
MDLSKIFVKDANPTKMGGQAVMEGIMMKGDKKTAVAVRLPSGDIHIKTEENPKKRTWAKIPIVRGVIVFVNSLIQGTKTLMYSADVLEKYEEKLGEGALAEKGKFETWLEKHFGERAVWNILIAISVIISLVFSIGIFVIGPTAVINWMTAFTENEIVLNLTEGLLRIAIFVIYVLLISKMKDIHRVFQYHGAEHKCIHCFESGRELTPENCQEFYTLHPRCGTSFLVFVLVISLIVFSFLGWPNLAARIISRLLLIPFIAGISYEVLKWAGKSDNWFIKIISIPGLYLQKLTTAPPDNEQLEVAIAAVKAVMDEDAPLYEGIAGKDGKFIKTAEEFYEEAGV